MFALIKRIKLSLCLYLHTVLTHLVIYKYTAVKITFSFGSFKGKRVCLVTVEMPLVCGYELQLGVSVHL